jgi:predicted MFS family arabinose efflux permease
MPRASALAPFKIRSYRFQWPGDLVTSWAFEMETLILGWYMLVATGSVVLLTLYGSLLFIGTLIAPMFGVMGDRIGHRNLLCGMRVIYFVLAAALMFLAFAGQLTPLYVCIIAALTGLVRPSDLGVRGALVASTIPHDQLTGAMSISRTTSDSARVVGALAGAGVFAAFGIGPAYVMITLLYALGALLTSRADGQARLYPLSAGEKHPSPWRDLKEGLGYVARTPRLTAVLWLAFLVNLTAFPFTTGLMPYIAREVYHTSQTGLGLLSASFSAGALIASIVLSTITGARLGRLMIVTTLIWYAMLLMFAHAQNLPVAIAFLAIAGFAQSFCMTPLAVILMRTSDERFRGRVMGVRMLAIYSLPLGLIAAGALIAEIGYQATISLSIALGLAFTLAIAIHWRAELWVRTAEANRR